MLFDDHNIAQCRTWQVGRSLPVVVRFYSTERCRMNSPRRWQICPERQPTCKNTKILRADNRAHPQRAGPGCSRPEAAEHFGLNHEGLRRDQAKTAYFRWRMSAHVAQHHCEMFSCI